MSSLLVDAVGVPAAAAIGATLFTSVLGSSTARSAASTQADAATAAAASTSAAADRTNAMNYAMYQQNLALQNPQLTAGQQALSALTGGLGLRAPTQFAGVPVGRTTTGAPQETPGAAFQPIGATPGPGFVGPRPQGTPGVAGTSGAQGAPGQQMAGTTPYGASNADMAAAANQYQGRFTQQFKPSDLTIDPSYQWRLNQGSQALNASAAARGMLGSGQNLKDVTNYAQGAASQEYGAAFDRYNTNQTNLYNRLASLAGVGQTAANNVGAAGQTAAGQMGQTTMGAVGAASNYLTGGASAQAAGQVGGYNAIAGGVQGGFNNWMAYQNQQNTQSYLNNLNPAGNPASPSFVGPQVPTGGAEVTP